MNIKTSIRVLTAATVLSLTACTDNLKTNAAQAEPSASTLTVQAGHPAVGHWEGEITLPTATLGMRLDLDEAEGAMSGTIDIPVQGMRGFKLVDVSVHDDQVSFRLPGIPGDPRFNGSLTADEQSITGKLSQSGQTFPFAIKRTIKQVREGETPGRGLPGEGFAGVWQGSLRPNAFELRLLIKLADGGDGLSGTLSSIDQDARDIPITKATQDGRMLHFEVATIHATFDGELSTDGSEVVGKWKQGSNALPLTIRRLEKAPDMSRPQDPAKPYPYDEEEVAFRNRAADVTLAGTLTSPRSPGPHPAVVLISGSGPQDRDEAIMGHRPFLVLADRLTRSGIVVLRYDDRGYQKSTGDFSSATTRDFTADALAAVDFLKTRTEVDAHRIGLIGHSEGGLIAPRAAVTSGDVAFIVLLAGPGVPMDELLARQSQDMLRIGGASGDVATLQAKLQSRIFEAVRAENGSAGFESRVRAVMEDAMNELTPEQRANLGFGPAHLENELRSVSSPWFRELLAIDPRPTLEQVRCPVLAINGSKDIQVAANDNLAGIRSALKTGGNTHATVVELPGLNHLFQQCTTGATTEYGTIEETFNEEALSLVTAWIQTTTKLN
jgi:uncharacterized protein